MRANRAYFIPKDAVKYEHKNSSAVAYVGKGTHNNPYSHIAVVFQGRHQRPSETMYAYTLEALTTRVTNWFLKVQQSEQKKQLDRTVSKEKAKVKSEQIVVGDILYSSWGYEQTNIDFYQITNKKGQTVELRELNQDLEATGSMQGRTKGIKDSFKNKKVLRKRLNGDGVTISSCQWASLWDGTPMGCSWYH